MKNKIDEKAKKRIITYIASAAGLFLWLLPTHGHVWKGEIEYIYISSESIYFLLIPILGLAIYVGSIWNDKQVIAFSGYVLYAICILLFFYQILTGWPLENIVIGTYLDLFFLL